MNNTPDTKSRILVAMSGGIDSSIAAIMLHEEGHQVVGITMKTWDYQTTSNTKKEIGCCSLDSINDARNVAIQFGFAHFVIDIREDFGKHVIDDFSKQYLLGKTPNPCVQCNTHIKWTALLKKADQLNCDYIATGHYAKIREENNRFMIAKSRDLKKDQSYALWGVTQKNLARTIFPLADYTKEEVKDIAKRYKLTDLIQKKESYEICFIPENDYRKFLEKKVPNLRSKIPKGKFLLEDGTCVGEHEGYYFYTIGQRKHLGISLGYPVYVTSIDPKTNTVWVGTLEHLACKGIYVKQLNLMKYPKIDQIQGITKIRYNDEGKASQISYKTAKDLMKIEFSEYIYAATPGQAAVFYEGNDVLGGGWIESTFAYKLPRKDIKKIKTIHAQQKVYFHEKAFS